MQERSHFFPLLSSADIARPFFPLFLPICLSHGAIFYDYLLYLRERASFETVKRAAGLRTATAGEAFKFKRI